MFVAKNLKTIRKKWKDNQSDFGARFGVSKTAVSKWELGENEPSLKVLFALEEMTGIPARRLFFEDIGEDEVGASPGQIIPSEENQDEMEIKYKIKISELVMELDESEKEKLQVFQALEMIHSFLEKNMDPAKFKAEKSKYAERIAAILSGEK